MTAGIFISRKGKSRSVRAPNLLTTPPLPSMMPAAPISTQPERPGTWAGLWYFIYCLRMYTYGTLSLIYHWAITPRYYAQITVLTLISYLTGRSFMLRHPHRPPIFIARPGSRDLHTYSITKNDVEHIFAEGVNLRSHKERLWRTATAIKRRFGHYAPFYQPTFETTAVLDLTSHKLIGPPLVQGLGIIGHHVNVILFEELGRCPSQPNAIVGKMFRWTDGRTILGKIPVKFVDIVGVRETVEAERHTVQWTWTELEDGKLQCCDFNICDKPPLPTPTPNDSLSFITSTSLPITIPQPSSVATFDPLLLEILG